MAFTRIAPRISMLCRSELTFVRSLETSKQFTHMHRCFSVSNSVISPPPLTSLTEEERMLRDTVRRFALERVAPSVQAMDEASIMDPSIITALFEAGLMGIEIPAQYGGAGMGFLSSCIAVEEMARVDASVAVCLDVQNTLVNNVFAKWASDDIKQRFWPNLATNTVGSFCLSEPESGSDAFALRTRADRLNDGSYVLNGSKAWITNGGEAGLFLVMANTAPAAGYKGITCFAVERNTPGFSVGKRERKLGIRASSTTPISIVDVHVPRENIVGEVGKGYKIAIEILNEGRIGIAAQMVGIAQGAFDTVMPYLFTRKQFGSFIGDFQAMQHQFAQAAVEIEAARLMVYNAARLKMANQTFVREAAMAKLYASQLWDTAGQERYRSLAPMYYRGASAAVVVFDVTNRDSFEGAKSWVKELQRRGDPNVVIALAGNKADVVGKRVVDLEEAKEYVRENAIIYMDTSAKTGLNVKEIFVAIAKELPKSIRSRDTEIISDLTLEPDTKKASSSSCCGGSKQQASANRN